MSGFSFVFVFVSVKGDTNFILEIRSDVRDRLDRTDTEVRVEDMRGEGKRRGVTREKRKRLRMYKVPNKDGGPCTRQGRSILRQRGPKVDCRRRSRFESRVQGRDFPGSTDDGGGSGER